MTSVFPRYGYKKIKRVSRVIDMKKTVSMNNFELLHLANVCIKKINNDTLFPLSIAYK